MRAIGGILRHLFDLLLYPLRPLSPMLALILVSLLAGLGMILLFRAASNQRAIADVRRRMGRSALAMILHVASPLVVAREGLRLIALNFVYLYHLLRPLAIMAVPLLLLFSQLDARFASASPPPGDTTLVTLRVAELPGDGDAVRPAFSGAAELLPPVVVIAELAEISFRMTANEPGFQEMTVYGVDLRLASGGVPTGVVVPAGGSTAPLDPLLRPALQPLDRGSTVRSVSFQLSPVVYRFWPGDWSWLGLFLLFSALGAILGGVIWKVRV